MPNNKHKNNVIQKDEIKDYLKNFTSPFSKVKIINPIFEDLWIKCKISFANLV